VFRTFVKFIEIISLNDNHSLFLFLVKQCAFCEVGIFYFTLQMCVAIQISCNKMERQLLVTTRETTVAGDQGFLPGVMIQISVLHISLISFWFIRYFVGIKVRTKENIGRRSSVREKGKVTWVRRVGHESTDMRIARMIWRRNPNLKTISKVFA